GLYNDKKAVKLRNSDGKTLATYSLNVNTYGAAIDRVQNDGSYHTWYVGNGPSALQFVKGGTATCSGSCVSPLFSVTDANCSDYGMAIDAMNRVYIQPSSCHTAAAGYYHKVWQFSPNKTYTAGTYRAAMLPWVNQGRGISVQTWPEHRAIVDVLG